MQENGPVVNQGAFTQPARNRQLVLIARPEGSPRASDFQYVEATRPQPGDNQFLVRNIYLSADPVQRGWASNPDLVPLGQPMRSLAVGVVLESRVPGIAEGEVVYGHFGWQDYAVASKADLLSHIPQPRAPLSAYAGALGMPGVTAWLALHDIAPPKPGDVVLVSTAAGAVGSVVGQIARKAGATVIGLTSGADKIARCVDHYGYHAACNYREGALDETLARALDAIGATGFSTYFDNTGGWILDTAIRKMAKGGRIIQCGTAATTSWNPPPTGLRNEREILMRTLTWSGFVIFDHIARFGQAIDALTDMLLAGELQRDEDIDVGLANAPAALESLFDGTNTGKKLVYIGQD